MTAKRDDARAYLQVVLGLDPLRDALNIVEERERAGRHRAPGSPELPAWGEVREGLGAFVDSTEGLDTGSASVREAASQLADLPLERQPDLQSLRGRLEKLERAWDDLHRAAEDRRLSGWFLETLEAILADRSAPRAKLRRDVKLSLAKRRKQVDILRADYPDLYRIEARWLQSLCESSRFHPRAKKGAGYGAWFFWFVVILILHAIGRG